jgi:hypothetical protein
MPEKFSILCGYSYAWKAGYVPTAFESLERVAVAQRESPDSDVPELVVKDRKLVEHVIDSYGKLGFLFLSRDCISDVNGKVPLSHMYVSYHLYNFVYDCKAFLDAVAVMLNDIYSIGRDGGDIDLKHCSFRADIMKAEPRLATTINRHKQWFLTVACWRDHLIHRGSTIVAPFRDSLYLATQADLNELIAKKPKCRMLMEPVPYLSPDMQRLKRKYGAATRDVDTFCAEWMQNACDLYSEVCDVIAEKTK